MTNIKLKNGSGTEVIYSNVDTITVPNATSGNSTFVDASADTATAADLLSGKIAHTSTGSITGTMTVYDGTVS